MKKFFTKLTACALMVCLSGATVAFTGCSNQQTVDYEHTIVFYSSQGDKLVKETANAIASFEAKYPGWKVEHATPGGYDEVKDKVISDLGAQTQPDLAYCYPDHVAQYIPTGKVVDLNKYIKSTEKVAWNVKDSEGNVSKHTTDITVGFTQAELDDFIPNYYKEGLATNFSGATENGFAEDSMITLPFVRSTELLYYNKTALDACGLKPAKTWDELWVQCDTLMKKFPKCTPLGYDSESNWFITMCEQNGFDYTSADPANHYTFNGENQAKWLEDLKDKYDKNYYTTQELYGAYTSGLFTKGVANEAGGIVYCIGSSGGAGYQDPGDAFEWGITSLPGTVREDGTINAAAISQGPSLVMLTGGNHVTNASEKEIMTFMFIKELLDPTFQTAFLTVSGYNVVRKSATKNQAYIDYFTERTTITEAVKQGAANIDNYFVSPAFVGSSTARTQVGNVIVYVSRGEKTPQKALKDAYTNCGGK